MDGERIGDPLHELMKLVLGTKEHTEDVLHRFVLPDHLLEQRALATEGAHGAENAVEDRTVRRGRDVDDEAVRPDRDHGDERRRVPENRGYEADAPHAAAEEGLAPPVLAGEREREAHRPAGPHLERVPQVRKHAGSGELHPDAKEHARADQVGDDANNRPRGDASHGAPSVLFASRVRPERRGHPVAQLGEVVPADARPHFRELRAREREAGEHARGGDPHLLRGVHGVARKACSNFHPRGMLPHHPRRIAREVRV